MMRIRHLGDKFRYVLSYTGAFWVPCFGVLHRAVLLVLRKVLCETKCLTIRLLNDIYIVADAKKSGYLCIAKVPYYGRSAYRHRAYGNASPLRDAAGSRGIVCKGWIS